MADSINKYASEAEYNSASHESTPEVSKVLGSASPVRYDGRNTDTTGSPSVGDAVYLDPDDNVRFISWKNLVPSALGTGWYPVGVVINRFGRKVRIRYKNSKVLPRLSAMIYVLSNQTSDSITFRIPTTSTSSTLVDLGSTFTATKALSADPAGFIAELDTWLRAHQPGKNGNPGMILDWHAEYIDNTPMIICDSTHKSYSSSNINVTCTGITATFTIYYPPPIEFSGRLPISCGYTLAHGIIYNPDAIVAYNVTTTPTSSVNANHDGNPVTEDAFNNSEYCSALRTTFATYNDYLCGRLLPCPTRNDAYFINWNKKSSILSNQMATYTYPNINGIATAYYPFCVWGIAPDESDKSSAVNTLFDWYIPGVIEGYFYCRYRGTTIDDPVWSTMGKISDNQNSISSLRSRTSLNSYKDKYTPWKMYNLSILSYSGGPHEEYYSDTVMSFADYDLTGRT